jgi:F0F1-type ATP synthase assembly protein I
MTWVDRDFVKVFTGGTNVTPTRKPDKDRPDLRSAGLLLAIPSLLIASPLVGFFLGKFADGKLHTTPWLTLVGVALGFAAAGREIASIVRRVQEDDSERRH